MACRDDHALLIAWREDDEQAGRELVARHYRSVGRFFANKAPDASDDLVQRTFEACVRQKHNIARGDRMLPYLLTIAKRELWAHLARRRRQPEATIGSIPALDTGPSTMAARSELQARVREALRELPLEVQATVEMFYWEDMTTPELAAALECPVGTVKTRLRRGRRLLAESLGRETGDFETQLIELAK